MMKITDDVAFEFMNATKGYFCFGLKTSMGRRDLDFHGTDVALFWNNSSF